MNAARHYCSRCGHSGDYAGTGPHTCPGCERKLSPVHPGTESSTSAAVDASPKSTTPAPEPRVLLQHLAEWLSACKYAEDHPWRVAIADTLADHQLTPTVTAEPLRPAQDCGDRVRFELHPVLAGLNLLTNAVRVLRAVSAHASLSVSFADDLSKACPTWADPFAHAGEASAESVVSDLARYAADLCAEIVVADQNGGAS